MAFDVTQILKRPIVTERTSLLRAANQFVFEVSPDSSKGQIREAVEAAFKVDVVSVRTMNVVGKYRRRSGPKGGYKSDWKKAIVKLKPGQEIKYAEPTA